MPNLQSEQTSIKHLRCPRTKGGHFLARVQAEMLKLSKIHGEVLARTELTNSETPPSYRLETPEGEHLLIISGASSRPAELRAVSSGSGWSAVALSFDQISEAALSLLSAEIDDLTSKGTRSA